MASNVVRAFPTSQQPLQPSQQDWVWDGANWIWCGCPPAPCPPMPSPPPCPPAGFPTPCPPWFPPPAAQAPWYPGANGGVSFSSVPPVNPIRGNLWWDGTMLHLFDGAAWVNIGPGGTTPGSSGTAGVTDGSIAAAGMIGEVLSATVTGSLTVAVRTAPSIATFSAITLTPGDWDVQAQVNISGMSGSTWADYFLFDMKNGATVMVTYLLDGAFTTPSNGFKSCILTSRSFPMSINTPTLLTGDITVACDPSGTPGTANYSYFTSARRRR